jgi:hypothetical protein
MDMTNNLGDETGPVSEDTQGAFRALLDSENATIRSEPDADTETDDVSLTSEDEFEGDEEQSVEDSDDLADEADDAEVEEETKTEYDLPDDDFVAARDENGNPLTVRELRDGYLRRDRFTQGLQDLAEQRKKYVTQEVQFHEVREHSERVLNELALHVAHVFEMTNFGPEPDWEQMLETHDAFDVQKERYRWEKNYAEWQRKQAAREGAVRVFLESQAEITRQNEAHAANMRQHDIIEGRETLARNMPDVFGDPKVANVNLLSVANYMRERGYDPAVIQNLTDARIIEDAYYAMIGRESMKKVQKAVAKIEAKPALTMPGTTASKKPASSAFNAKLREHVKSGSKDTQSLFRHLLDNE